MMQQLPWHRGTHDLIPFQFAKSPRQAPELLGSQRNKMGTNDSDTQRLLRICRDHHQEIQELYLKMFLKNLMKKLEGDYEEIPRCSIHIWKKVFDNLGIKKDGRVPKINRAVQTPDTLQENSETWSNSAKGQGTSQEIAQQQLQSDNIMYNVLMPPNNYMPNTDSGMSLPLLTQSAEGHWMPAQHPRYFNVTEDPDNDQIDAVMDSDDYAYDLSAAINEQFNNERNHQSGVQSGQSYLPYFNVNKFIGLPRLENHIITFDNDLSWLLKSYSDDGRWPVSADGQTQFELGLPCIRRPPQQLLDHGYRAAAELVAQESKRLYDLYLERMLQYMVDGLKHSFPLVIWIFIVQTHDLLANVQPQVIRYILYRVISVLRESITEVYPRVLEFFLKLFELPYDYLPVILRVLQESWVRYFSDRTKNPRYLELIAGRDIMENEYLSNEAKGNKLVSRSLNFHRAPDMDGMIIDECRPDFIRALQTYSDIKQADTIIQLILNTLNNNEDDPSTGAIRADLLDFRAQNADTLENAIDSNRALIEHLPSMKDSYGTIIMKRLANLESEANNRDESQKYEEEVERRIKLTM